MLWAGGVSWRVGDKSEITDVRFGRPRSRKISVAIAALIFLDLKGSLTKRATPPAIGSPRVGRHHRFAGRREQARSAHTATSSATPLHADGGRPRDAGSPPADQFDQSAAKANSLSGNGVPRGALAARMPPMRRWSSASAADRHQAIRGGCRARVGQGGERRHALTRSGERRGASGSASDAPWARCGPVGQCRPASHDGCFAARTVRFTAVSTGLARSAGPMGPVVRCGWRRGWPGSRGRLGRCGPGCGAVGGCVDGARAAGRADAAPRAVRLAARLAGLARSAGPMRSGLRCGWRLCRRGSRGRPGPMRPVVRCGWRGSRGRLGRCGPLCGAVGNWLDGACAVGGGRCAAGPPGSATAEVPQRRPTNGLCPPDRDRDRGR
ncbi:hypothetical protein DFJ67_8272 [Asanoa ferruginea]|uniref:Uncharacterized protein n=1 Tax=Asanoa ferruginea TaxID=53367 RepID=A0A3D9ZYU2_9ACTN|nr:hypothetical protein DFJ67_8272 [Asanoa ferruginea]